MDYTFLGHREKSKRIKESEKKSGQFGNKRKDSNLKSSKKKAAADNGIYLNERRLDKVLSLRASKRKVKLESLDDEDENENEDKYDFTSIEDMMCLEVVLENYELELEKLRVFVQNFKDKCVTFDKFYEEMYLQKKKLLSQYINTKEDDQGGVKESLREKIEDLSETSNYPSGIERANFILGEKLKKVTVKSIDSLEEWTYDISPFLKTEPANELNSSPTMSNQIDELPVVDDEPIRSYSKSVSYNPKYLFNTKYQDLLLKMKLSLYKQRLKRLNEKSINKRVRLEEEKATSSKDESLENVDDVCNDTPMTTANEMCEVEIFMETKKALTISYLDGSKYIGEKVSVKNNLQTRGVYLCKNGSRYVGNFVNYEVSGYGVKDYNNGDIYIGDYLNTMKNGYGLLISPNNDYYEGCFSDNQKNGHGRFTYANGDTFEGDYRDNQKISGVFVWGKKSVFAGDVYRGEFFEGDQHGHGKYVSKDGSTYTGGWLHNKRNGHGVLITNGKRTEGMFSNDFLCEIQPDDVIVLD
jgi:hypothetical protein